MLGQGEMSIEGRDIEIWTRLVIETDRGWLEIYNALDENGYEFYAERPEGNLVRCTGQERPDFYCHLRLRVCILRPSGYSAIELNFDNRKKPPEKAEGLLFLPC